MDAACDILQHWWILNPIILDFPILESVTFSKLGPCKQTDLAESFRTMRVASVLGETKLDNVKCQCEILIGSAA